MTVLYGAGPLAAGYLFWELALPKARVQTLSLIAAATPILSTLLLCGFLKTPPGPELLVAALLVSGGVLLSATE
jgi:drug/metabolite transporter (DMT)-like permease